MAEKLTKQMDQTDKKLTDIAKSRLGSAYKNIIKLGLNDEEEVIITDVATAVLSNISPTGYANEHIVSTEAGFNSGTGDYKLCEFNFCVATADLCNKWYYYDITEFMINKTIVIKISSPPTSSVNYNDTKVGRLGSASFVAPNGRYYSRLEKVARDVNLIDSPDVNVIIKPTEVGRYFIGMQSPTNDTTSDTLTWSYGSILKPNYWYDIDDGRGGRWLSGEGTYGGAYRQGLIFDISDNYYVNNQFIMSYKQVYAPPTISPTVRLKFKSPINGNECGTVEIAASSLNSYPFVQEWYNESTGGTTHNARCYHMEILNVNPQDVHRVFTFLGDTELYNVIPADDTGAAYGKRFYVTGLYVVSPLGAPTVTANGVSVIPVQKYGSIYSVSGSAPWVFDRPVMMMNASCIWSAHSVGHPLFDTEGSLNGTDFWFPLPKLGSNVTSITPTIMIIPLGTEPIECTYTKSNSATPITVTVPVGGINLSVTNAVGEMFMHLTTSKPVRIMIQYYKGPGSAGGEFSLPMKHSIPNTRYSDYITMQDDYLDMSPRSDDDIIWEKVFPIGTTYGDVGAVSWTELTFPQKIGNLVCHVAMSTDGVNFGSWVGVYNGGNFPSVPGATHVKVRLTAPLNIAASNTQSSDDNWVSNIKVLYYTYTQQ